MIIGLIKRNWPKGAKARFGRGWTPMPWTGDPRRRRVLVHYDPYCLYINVLLTAAGTPGVKAHRCGDDYPAARLFAVCVSEPAVSGGYDRTRRVGASCRACGFLPTYTKPELPG